MLVTEGLEPSTDAETFAEFETRIASKGVIPIAYRELGKKVGDLGPKDTTAQSALDKMNFAKGFVDACRSATDLMGKDLKLAAVQEEQPAAAPASAKPSAPVPTGAPVYDLRGVACPLNYVKTKLKLEMMDAGDKLEVWLDAGEPIKNVPMSLKNDGHVIHLQEALEPEAAHYRILVEKVEG